MYYACIYQHNYILLGLMIENYIFVGKESFGLLLGVPRWQGPVHFPLKQFLTVSHANGNPKRQGRDSHGERADLHTACFISSGFLSSAPAASTRAHHLTAGAPGVWGSDSDQWWLCWFYVGFAFNLKHSCLLQAVGNTSRPTYQFVSRVKANPSLMRLCICKLSQA